MIEAYSFGRMIIDGKKYISDLVIYPDGHVEDSWWRRKGHSLSIEDISALVRTAPKIIIAGMGASGLMKPEKDLAERLHKQGIEFIPLPNPEAVEYYNDLSSKKPVGACFHLTC